ncbi:hypothetical protein PV327_004158 [Microctonus hyperodae]|uniref:Uncharacterized protein n=1 Tax=Microctonus hyperodae TaxID=165561 RepID=A0AA39FC36_MICHY|nr:hypothetical protein PV327_004158 [Microctonus hyperodae]
MRGNSEQLSDRNCDLGDQSLKVHMDTTFKVEEHVIKFVPVTSVTRQNLANVLLTTLSELDIVILWLGKDTTVLLL